MSLFKPKDGDYVVRGLFLMLGWWIFGTPVLIFAIALVSGNGNVGVLGIPIALSTAIVGYGLYLNFGLRVHDKEMSKRLELMIEERRIELEMQGRGYMTLDRMDGR